MRNGCCYFIRNFKCREIRRLHQFIEGMVMISINIFGECWIFVGFQLVLLWFWTPPNKWWERRCAKVYSNTGEYSINNPLFRKWADVDNVESIGYTYLMALTFLYFSCTAVSFAHCFCLFTIIYEGLIMSMHTSFIL